jgi:hypothetical protein
MNDLQQADASALRTTLAAIVPDLRRYCDDPWMLIGSAAARMVGADVTVADLDVLTSEDDAAHLQDCWATYRDDNYVPADGNRFRSHFARFTFLPLPVEIMGGLELFGAEGWESVKIEHAVLIDVDGVDVLIPTPDEQIRLLEIFGRPKDMTRTMSLKSLQHQRS